MEVVIHSTLNAVPGRIIVHAEPTDTVGELINKFCAEKEVARESTYALRNKDQEPLHNGRRVNACNILNGDVLYVVVKGESY